MVFFIIYKKEANVINNNQEILEYDIIKIIPKYRVDSYNIVSTYDTKHKQKQVQSEQAYKEKLAVNNPNIELVGKYIGASSRTLHRCKRHNYIWNTSPTSILQKNTIVGCPLCSKEKIRAKALLRSKSREQYELELKDNCPTVVLIGQYVNISTNALHKCLTCEYEWMTLPSRMLKKGIMFGCPKCADKYHALQKSMGMEKYKKRLFEVNQDIICIDEVYVNNSTKLKHKCLICGYLWEAIPNNILKGHGCPNCAKGLISIARSKTHEEFLEDFNRSNPFKDQIKILGTYFKSHECIECQCLVCNSIWKCSPSNLLKGYGCPYCHASDGERIIKLILDKYNIKYEFQKAFDDLIGLNNHCLTYDFYLPDYNTLIERQGQQHEYPVEYFGGEKAFIKQQEHDKRKRDYAREHGINLLEIWYYELEKTEEILINYLNLKSVTTAECA